MTRDPLNVHLYGRHVANIIDTGFGDTAVGYTDDANEQPVTSRLSLALPVQTGLHITNGPGGRWVRSLLPEGRALDWAVEHFGVPENDRFGLIGILGLDVAGAVQILTDGTPTTKAGRYEPLTGAETAEHVLRAPDVGLGLDRSRGIRLSLAGMQDKVLLHRVDGRYFLPIHGAPSTLIVKPEPRTERPDRVDLTGLATNELYCLTLAAMCKLPVAAATVERFDGVPAIVVERYDRMATGEGITRLHQEDLLSALGRDPLHKYETPHVQRLGDSGGWGDTAARVAIPGPSLRDLAGLLGTHLGRAGVVPFLEAVTFNIVIGNADAHARNYSIILPPDGNVRLAPLYDLVSTRMWDELDRDPAQKVNGVDDIDKITLDDLVAEAVTWDLPAAFVRRRAAAVVDRVVEHARSCADRTVALGGDQEIAERLSMSILARAAMVRR